MSWFEALRYQALRGYAHYIAQENTEDEDGTE